MVLRFTTREGLTTPSFIRSSRSIPPALATTGLRSVLFGQQRDGLLHGLGIDPLEALHDVSPMSQARSAASTLAGVIGSVRMRLPVAL